VLDRTRIHVEVPRVNDGKLSSEQQGEVSSVVRERIMAAWRGKPVTSTTCGC
jgi:hypothetical protein